MINNILCPLCSKNVDSLHRRSHLVPEWMYKDMYNEKRKLINVNLSKEFVKKEQKGIYDEIICRDCESISQEYDRYASLLLTERSPNAKEHSEVIRKYQEVNGNSRPLKYSFWSNLDFLKYQKFLFVCVLRAYFSSLKKGKPLLVEKHFKGILDLYNSEDRIDDSSYPILTIKYSNTDGSDNVVFLPFTNRKDGHYFIEFTGAGYGFSVYVSSHKKPSYIENLSLKKNGSMYMIHEEIQRTGTFGKVTPNVRDIARKFPKFRP